MNAKVSIGAKHLLAKLMAEENITVIHRQGASTAMFDGNKRVLILPIWKEMEGFTYSHLIGHEVGHALFSIPVISQGMDDAIDYIDGNNRNLVKNFLNVCEDARIEKLMIRKYPGLAMDFRNSYKKLMDDNMFGTKGKNINDYPLADRVNIQAKLGSLIDIPFTEKEKKIFDEVMAANTWDQTVVACKKLYDYCSDMVNQQNDQSGEGDSEENSKPGKNKNNKGNNKKSKNKDQEDYENSGTLPEKKKNNSKKEDGEDSSDDSGESKSDETDGDGDKEGKDSGQSDDSGDQGEDSSDNGGDSGDGQDGEASDTDGNGEGDGEENDDEEGDGALAKESSELSKKYFGKERIPPTCDTQKIFDSRSQDLVNKNAKNIEYYTIPKAILPKVIVPYKKVISNIINFYTTNYKNCGDEGRVAFEKFRSENKPYIDYMVQEFNLKKAADDTQRATVAKTGKIDVSQIHSYKFNDDIFLRATILPGEKNHALVLFVDFSGSMAEHMLGTIEQALNLALYCRALNIPFEMYSFGACGERVNYNYSTKQTNWIASNDDFLVHDVFRLRQYFGIGMGQKDFNDACVALYTMGVEHKKNACRGAGVIPPEESLGGTPLNETILAAFSIVENVQKKTKAQITTVSVITDGEAGYYNQRVNPVQYNYGNGNDDILRDPVTKMEWRMNYYNQTAILIEALRHRLNVNAIGFYICNGNASVVKNTAASMLKRYHPDTKITEDEVKKKVEEDHYYGINDTGYQTYFIIAGGKDISTNSSGLINSGNIDADFINKAKFKKKKRVILGRFVELMANKTVLGNK